jgi:hypothetical protein
MGPLAAVAAPAVLDVETTHATHRTSPAREISHGMRRDSRPMPEIVARECGDAPKGMGAGSGGSPFHLLLGIVYLDVKRYRDPAAGH